MNTSPFTLTVVPHTRPRRYDKLFRWIITRDGVEVASSKGGSKSEYNTYMRGWITLKKLTKGEQHGMEAA